MTRAKTKPRTSRELTVKFTPRKLIKIASAVIVLVLLVFVGLKLFTGGQEAIDFIAVLPFVNASGDPNAEYLSDDLEILSCFLGINVLSLITKGHVAGHDS